MFHCRIYLLQNERSQIGNSTRGNLQNRSGLHFTSSIIVNVGVIHSIFCATKLHMCFNFFYFNIILCLKIKLLLNFNFTLITNFQKILNILLLYTYATDKDKFLS